jgi:phage head maturation protease
MASEILTRTAAFEPSSFDTEQRTVQVVFSTGADVERSDFEGPYIERLSMDPSAVDLSQLIGGPVLDNHDRFSGVRAILGVVETAAVDGKRGVATIRFSERPEVQGIAADVQAGIIRSVSAGYTVQTWQTEKRSDGTRIKTATRWTPKEISFTPLAADAGARVRGQNMNEELQTQIRGIAAAVGVQTAFADDLIQRNVSVDDARAAIIREAAKNTPAIDNRQPAVVTREQAPEDVTRAAGEALYCRIDPAYKPSEQARPFVGRRMADVARELLRLRGLNTFGSDAEVITRSLNTTSDLANVVSTFANKAVAQSYQTAPSGLKVVCKRGASHPDFKGRTLIRRGELPTLEKVTENGEFTRGSIVDSKESYSVSTFGRVFGMSRQLVINDDLGLLADIASGWGLAAQEFENMFLAKKLAENSKAGPKLADGKPIFDAAHGNLASPGAAISDATLAAARLALRTMKGMDGVTPINATPKFLLVPAALENSAEKYLSTIYPAQAANVNPFGGTNKLTLVVDPRLDSVISATAWYVFADPAVLPCIEFAYLAGFEGVSIETRNGFDVDGVEVRARLDFGAGGIDFRGAYKGNA